MGHKHIVLTVALSLGLASVAWSDEPSATQPAAAATSSDAAAAKAKEAQAAAAAKEDEAGKHLLARGYKKETHGNQTVYCRKEIKTGSHFETKVCGTAESMALAEQQARDLMQNSQNSSGSRVN